MSSLQEPTAGSIAVGYGFHYRTLPMKLPFVPKGCSRLLVLLISTTQSDEVEISRPAAS